MEVSYGLPPGAVIVSAVGRVDEASWEEFGSHVARGIEIASNEGRDTVVIDLSHIDYMSSRGLRALTMAKQEGIAAGVSLRLAAPNDVMREILAISRYDRLFPVDDALPARDGSEA